MKDERSLPLLPLTIATLVVVLMTAYVIGYFTLDCRGWSSPDYVIRDYRSDWLAAIYRPAGRVEAALCGCNVCILSDKEYPGEVEPAPGQ